MSHNKDDCLIKTVKLKLKSEQPIARQEGVRGRQKSVCKCELCVRIVGHAPLYECVEIFVYAIGRGKVYVVSYIHQSNI